MCLCVLGKDRGGEKSAMNLTGPGGGAATPTQDHFPWLSEFLGFLKSLSASKIICLCQQHSVQDSTQYSGYVPPGYSMCTLLLLEAALVLQVRCEGH